MKTLNKFEELSILEAQCAYEVQHVGSIDPKGEMLLTQIEYCWQAGATRFEINNILLKYINYNGKNNSIDPHSKSEK